MEISEIIKNLNLKILKKYNDFKGAYLYGSYAKGTSHKDSDVDVVFLFDSITEDKVSYIYNLLGQSDYENNIITIGLIYTPKDLEKNYIFHNEVVNKGIYYNAA